VLSPAARFCRSAGKMLIVGALLAFLASLPLPAAAVNTGWGGRNDKPLPGWGCLVFGILYYPSNALLLASPVVALFTGLPRSRFRSRCTSALLYTLSAALVLTARHLFDLSLLSTGYYLWITAHCAVAAAFWVLCADGGTARGR
jgi:hypothetical protein